MQREMELRYQNKTLIMWNNHWMWNKAVLMTITNTAMVQLQWQRHVPLMRWWDVNDCLFAAAAGHNGGTVPTSLQLRYSSTCHHHSSGRMGVSDVSDCLLQQLDIAAPIHLSTSLQWKDGGKWCQWLFAAAVGHNRTIPLDSLEQSSVTNALGK